MSTPLPPRSPVSSPAAPASSASSNGPLLPFPARMGMMLAEPRRALEMYDARGGGVRDAGYLVLLGLLCFRLEDVTRALLGISHLSFGTVLRQMLAVVSQEVQEAIIVVLPAAVAVVIGVGRQKRDPSRDLELGAAAYVPFFAVRAVYRAADLEALLGPLSPSWNRVASGVALLWTAVVLALAIGVGRRRTPTPPAAAVAAGGAPAAAGPVVEAGPLPVPHIRSRVAVAALAALVGAALFVNGAWVVRNVDAIRPLTRGKDAPNFTLPRVDGQPGTVSLAQLKGKVVLLDFWATWCQPCIHMLPTLHGLYQDWQGKGVELVGINSDGPSVTAAEITAFLRERPGGYPMVMDQDGQVGSLYKVVALPHLVLVGRDGTIMKSFWGVTSRRELDRALELALK